MQYAAHIYFTHAELYRKHLFCRYIYVCTTTICVYIGVSVVAATVTYTNFVLGLRKKMLYKLSHQQ